MNRFFTDLRAGLSAAIIGLPQEVNYGLLAVAPLGAAFAGRGVAAALYGSALAVFILILLGAGAGRIAGPRPTLCILVAGLITTLLRQPGITPATLPIFVALTVMLAGLMLVAASRLGLGRLIKYLPVAVLAGFTNGVAGLLLLSALPLALGAGINAGGPAEWLSHLQPAALAVAAVTVWLSMHPLRFSLLRHVPAIVQSLFCAWLLHLLLTRAGLPAGPTLGDLLTGLPGPDILLTSLAMPSSLTPQLGIMLQFAAAIAVAATLETLATAASIDARLNERTSSNRELRRMGVTMMLLSPLGMPVAGSLGRSMTLLSNGAQSRAAQLCYVLSLLALALLGYALLALLPQAAIAGILITVACGMSGDSVRQAVSQLRAAGGRAERMRSTADFLVMLLVALITVVDSFITGMAAGIVSAMALFIRDQGRSVIRRVQFGSHCRSLRLRSPQAQAIQERHGSEIAVIEAEGALFFGSAEQLAKRVAALCNDATDIVIDLRRVSDIDATATHLLGQTARRLREKNCYLTLSHLPPGSRLRGILETRGLAEAIPSETWFADLDGALECAEDRLLARHGLADGVAGPLPLGRSDLATGLTPAQLGRLEGHLTPRLLQAGDIVFREGDTDKSLFIVMRGALSVRLQQPGSNGKRLAAFGPGAIIGEMAMITGAPRSANAIADEETELLELDNKHLQYLEMHQPDTATALLRAIATILAGRLRNTTLQLRELAEE